MSYVVIVVITDRHDYGIHIHSLRFNRKVAAMEAVDWFNGQSNVSSNYEAILITDPEVDQQ